MVDQLAERDRARYYGANATGRTGVPPVLTVQTRKALERYERETGERIADNVPDPEDEAMVGLFLIMAGCPPEDGRDDSPH
jgi:hypothetical protein